MSVRRILLVEDDALIRTDVAGALRDEGYVVDEAKNGAEGLERMRSARPDLVLLDLMAPVMNGWEFRTAQLAEPKLKRVPVVLISGIPELKDAQEELHAWGSVEKPFRIDELLSIVTQVCQEG